MNANINRRAIMTAGALAVFAPGPAQADPRYRVLAEQLATASADRRTAVQAFRAARRRVARWGEANLRPDVSDGGAALLAWLAAYRDELDASGARDRHRDYHVAHAYMMDLAQSVTTIPVRSTADARALAALAANDCEGIMRAALLDRLASL